MIIYYYICIVYYLRNANNNNKTIYLTVTHTSITYIKYAFIIKILL